MATGDLTPEIVRSLLAYDPESGQFTWIKRRGTRTDLDGNIAGSLTNGGYWKITVAGRHFLAHRLVFIRQLLRWRAERGDDWMRGFVADWKRWPGLREDFKRQWAAGGRGAEGDWR